MKLQFQNYKGEMVNAPKDLKNIIAKYDGDTIVWSESGGKHRVRYALQVDDFSDSIEAAKEFGCCVHHLEACNGKI